MTNKITATVAVMAIEIPNDAIRLLGSAATPVGYIEARWAIFINCPGRFVNKATIITITKGMMKYTMFTTSILIPVTRFSAHSNSGASSLWSIPALTMLTS